MKPNESLVSTQEHVEKALSRARADKSAPALADLEEAAESLLRATADTRQERVTTLAEHLEATHRQARR